MLRHLLTPHVRTIAKSIFIKPNLTLKAQRSLINEIRRSSSTKHESFEIIKKTKDSKAVGMKTSQNYAVFDEHSKSFLTKNHSGDSSLPPSVRTYINSQHGGYGLAGLGVVNENTEQRWLLPRIIWIMIGLIFLHDLYQRYHAETNTVIIEHTTAFGKTYHISNRIKFFVTNFTDEEFIEIHDKMKQRGVRVEQSFWNKRIWHFVYSRRRTPYEAWQADVELHNLVMEEIEEFKNRKQFTFTL